MMCVGNMREFIAQRRSDLGIEEVDVDAQLAQAAESIAVGQRFRHVDSGERGVVLFIGRTHFKAGHWIGVQYDESVGKTNGTYVAHHRGHTGGTDHATTMLSCTPHASPVFLCLSYAVALLMCL